MYGYLSIMRHKQTVHLTFSLLKATINTLPPKSHRQRQQRIQFNTHIAYEGEVSTFDMARTAFVICLCFVGLKNWICVTKPIVLLQLCRNTTLDWYFIFRIDNRNVAIQKLEGSLDDKLLTLSIHPPFCLSWLLLHRTVHVLNRLVTPN